MSDLVTNAQRFKQVVKGKNIMTPTIIKYGQQGDYVYELSKGRGMTDNEIYGVTVVDLRIDKHRSDLSQMFFELELAEEYINDLEKRT